MSSAPTLIALLSLLLEKGILTEEEVADIRKHGKLAPLLIAQGFITKEEFEGRFDEVKRILEITSLIVQGRPVTPAMMNVIRSCQDRFPGLVRGILEAMEEREGQ